MKITKQPINRFQYVFEFDFNYSVLAICRGLKTRYGAKKINFYKGEWRFNDLRIVGELKKTFTGLLIDVSMYEDMQSFKREQEERQERINKAHKIKEATTSNLEIGDIKADLYPYQKLGVEFFMNNNGKGILADTMGLGKTLQTLSYIVHSKKEKTIVICPASVKYAWESEVNKWTKLKPIVLNGKDFDDFDSDTFLKHDVFIINYDLIKKYLNKLIALKWDCMVCDEFHYIKNTAAMRTKATRKLGKKIESILLLSGTPILNRPVELFNGLNMLDEETWHDYRGYTRRYCGAFNGRFGWDTSGATHIEELQGKISHYFLRRKKEEVLKDLPPKRYIDMPVALDKSVTARYAFAEKEFLKYLREIKNKEVKDNKRTENAYKLARLNELRQLASEGKLYLAKEIIENVISNGEKIIVFSAFNKPLEDLKEMFGDKAVMLTGKTEAEQRKEAIDKFQNDSKVQIFLGGIKSAGVGITLTAASNVLFIDYSWVPADHWQGEDRAHRIGQEADSVSVYQLYSNGTIDEYMRETIERKKELFNKLIENDEPISKTKNVSMMNDIVKKYEEKL